MKYIIVLFIIVVGIACFITLLLKGMKIKNYSKFRIRDLFRGVNYEAQSGLQLILEGVFSLICAVGLALVIIVYF